MKTVVGLMVLSAMAVAGCATGPTEAEKVARDEIARTIPTCSEEKECATKWSAARTWIIANSGWKLQHVTPDYLETYNAINSSPRIAVRVNKEPIANGQYQLVAAVWCDNIFGCQPNKLDAMLDFNRKVNASWTPVKPAQ